MWEHMIAWLPNWKAKIYDYIPQSLKSTVLILSKMHLTVYVLLTLWMQKIELWVRNSWIHGPWLNNYFVKCNYTVPH